jgi:hypothetical protein
MSIKSKLTSVAVDSARDYFIERLNQLKELDLDHDGQKDVEQIKEVLHRLSVKVKDAVEATDFQKLATGLDQIASGATLIGSSLDRQQLRETGAELCTGLKQLGKLMQLGIAEVKRDENRA